VKLNFSGLRQDGLARFNFLIIHLPLSWLKAAFFPSVLSAYLGSLQSLCVSPFSFLFPTSFKTLK